jgi:AraC family transcriptional regulator of adaptative response / DNA-3-methyladenine glycosylase II
VIEARIRPRGVYSLRLSTRFASDATRRVEGGVLTALLPEGRARAWQRPDGVVEVRADSEPAVERLRFCLALDDDHTEFLRRFAGDPLLGETTRRLRGLRPVRVATVTQALLRALAGQLIAASEARRIERRVVRAAVPAAGPDELRAPPTAAQLGAFSPAQLHRYGLGTRRATTLVRLCRTLDPERLREVGSAAVAARLQREPGLGPWSVGVVALQGLGRYDLGLARDLGLVKLLSELRGRWVEAPETDELLEPYGEWAGLASVYLLAGYAQGLVPVRRAAAA